MIDTRVIEDPEEARAWVPRWRELLGRAASPEPVLTPLWVLTWWDVFGGVGGRAMRLVAFIEGGELVGLAPFVARRTLYRGAIPFRRLELMGTGEDEADEVCSDYGGVLAVRGYEARVCDTLARALTRGELGEWDEVVVANMNGEHEAKQSRGLRDAIAAVGAKAALERAGECPFIPLPPSWDDYLGQLDGPRRYGVRRSLRDLEAWAGAGGYALTRASNARELHAGLRTLSALHGERWEDAGRPGAFASERFLRFHEAVMPALLGGTDGGLDLLSLVVRGEPVAALYNIVYRGKVYFYQSGRKVDVPKRVKPGVAIHALAVERAIVAQYREYDFLNGASRYKRELSLASRPLVTLRAVAPTVRARSVEAAREVAEAAATRIRALRRSAPGRSVIAAVRGAAGTPGSSPP